MRGLYLRKAEYSDIELLFHWANDPAVRKYSFHTKPIPYEDHATWFHRMMEDDSVLQFIMMDDQVPVGQIRLNITGDEAEIGYSIAKEYRGKGYGNAIIELAAELVNKQFSQIKKLVAKVRPDNAGSVRVFEKQGFHTDYYCFSLPTNEENDS